jgi:hypothetical protein
MQIIGVPGVRDRSLGLDLLDSCSPEPVHNVCHRGAAMGCKIDRRVRWMRSPNLGMLRSFFLT